LNWSADGSTQFSGYTDGVVRVWGIGRYQLLFLIVADLKVLGFCWFYIYDGHGFEAIDVLVCLLACLCFVADDSA
jgi:hypothetical protein